MATFDLPQRQPVILRLLMAIPVIGWILRDLLFGDSDTIWYVIGGGVSLWGILVLTYGLPGLYIPALAMVPVIFCWLISITWA